MQEEAAACLGVVVPWTKGRQVTTSCLEWLYTRLGQEPGGVFGVAVEQMVTQRYTIYQAQNWQPCTGVVPSQGLLQQAGVTRKTWIELLTLLYTRTGRTQELTPTELLQKLREKNCLFLCIMRSGVQPTSFL